MCIRDSRYSEQDTTDLISILEAEDNPIYRENAALTLGLIGSEKAVKPFIDHIGMAQNELSNSDIDDIDKKYIGKGISASLIALGYIVNRTDNSTALNYLMQFASNKSDNQNYALHGLGFAGNEISRKYIEDLSLIHI